MRKNVSRIFSVLIAVAVLLTAPAFADLGLAQLAAQPQGASAVGQAVLDAVRAIYAGSSDSAVIQSQLTPILNEAAATGNELAVRYAIVAVIVGGGAENFAQSKDAIDGSDVFGRYPELTAMTVAAAKSLLTAGAAGEKGAGGDKSGGDKGGGDQQLGGGDPTWFPFWDSFPSDNDVPATRI